MNLGNPNLGLLCSQPPTILGEAADPQLPRRVLRELTGAQLTPGPRVNALFSDLVSFALATTDPELLADADDLSRLQALCAAAETELERHWAQLITGGRATFRDFPYWEHYLALMRGENLALSRHARGRRLVVIGCGPLPLSAIALHRINPQWRITCIDSDPAALDAATRVLSCL
ncbi:MAG: nicotianamine synthase family protein, partial [Angustibacter sp.]